MFARYNAQIAYSVYVFSWAYIFRRAVAVSTARRQYVDGLVLESLLRLTVQIDAQRRRCDGSCGRRRPGGGQWSTAAKLEAVYGRNGRRHGKWAR